MPGWRSIVILLILVIGLGAWVAWLQTRPQPGEPELADLDPKAIEQITVKYQERTLRFQHRGNGWRMQQPYTAPADPYRIEQILQLPRAKSYSHYSIPRSDWSRFGLEPPQAEVDLDGHRFRFGRQNPIDFRRYVQVDDQAVHLIDDTLFHLLTSPPADWLDTHLLPATAAIRALELPGWQIRMSPKGGWQSQPKADPTTLQRWIDEWRNARALRITPYSKPAPKDKPIIRVRLEGGTVTFVLLAEKPEVILLRPDRGLAYHFYRETGLRLLQAPKTEQPQDS